jgi:poly-gamma-glutamate capsule biosynthesis protein CapA/YwtB (metallophosphatase superfamily)
LQSDILYKPIGLISIFNKLIVRILWLFFRTGSNKNIHKKNRNFEENPANMTFKESWYLGFKYYFESPQPELKAVNFFKSNPVVIHNKFIGSKISISLGGDLMPYRLINQKSCEHLWNNIGSKFFDADIVFANLETPIVSSKKPRFVPEVMLHHMNFNASLEQLEIFSGGNNNAFKGYDVLSCANNHSFDMGVEGIFATQNLLKQRNIAPIGISSLPNAYQDVVIKEVNGIKVGWLAYTFSINHHQLPQEKSFMVNALRLNNPDCDFTEIKEKVDFLRNSGADFIVGSFHMGNAYQPLPNFSMINQVTRLVNETDIDLFVGTHPHNLQPNAMITNRRGKVVPAMFSLGDFVAWDIYKFGHLSQIVKLELTRNQTGEVIISNFESNPIFCMLDKKLNLRFIELKEAIESQKTLGKQLFLKGEINLQKSFYEKYIGF